MLFPCGQLKLKNTSVLCIGAGGLANSALAIIVSSGIGKVGIVDFDKVALSNLHRQFLFSTHDLGKSKVAVAKDRLNAINSNI